jgi:hypothetical protein
MLKKLSTRTFTFTYFNIHNPVGNSNIFTQDSSSISLLTQGVTYPGVVEQMNFTKSYTAPVTKVDSFNNFD